MEICFLLFQASPFMLLLCAWLTTTFTFPFLPGFEFLVLQATLSSFKKNSSWQQQTSTHGSTYKDLILFLARLGYIVVITHQASDEFFPFKVNKEDLKHHREDYPSVDPWVYVFSRLVYTFDFTPSPQARFEICFVSTRSTELTPKYPVSEKTEFHHNKKGKYLTSQVLKMISFLCDVGKNQETVRQATSK